VALLNEREREIVRERMLTDNPVTLEELGVRFGISRERIRQIEKRAFEKLSDLVRRELAAAAI
jgi:RNA polymerase sigma-32 factor